MKKVMKGFTLIELLIVIAIIGILAVALLPTVLGAPAKGRDAARMSNLDAIVTAVEAANLDKGGYPTAAFDVTRGTSLSVAYNSLSQDISTYFQGKQVPGDPSGSNAKPPAGGAAGSYRYCPLSGSGQNYYLVSYMESPGSANINNLPTACTTTPPTTVAVGSISTCQSNGCGFVVIK